MSCHPKLHHCQVRRWRSRNPRVRVFGCLFVASKNLKAVENGANLLIHILYWLYSSFSWKVRSMNRTTNIVVKHHLVIFNVRQLHSIWSIFSVINWHTPAVEDANILHSLTRQSMTVSLDAKLVRFFTLMKCFDVRPLVSARARLPT